jgi:hypothetical protein
MNEACNLQGFDGGGMVVTRGLSMLKQDEKRTRPAPTTVETTLTEIHLNHMAAVVGQRPYNPKVPPANTQAAIDAGLVAAPPPQFGRSLSRRVLTRWPE